VGVELLKNVKTKASKRFGCLAALILCLAGAGCERQRDERANAQGVANADVEDSLAWLLAPHEGQGRIDRDIRSWQEQLRTGANPRIALERLGWLFIAKAQESFDAGFYKLAEQCALGLNAQEPGSLDAMLLHGHALQNQHRFKEAEPTARELVAKRALPFDYGLLGDVLMELGKLSEATDAYQMMIDLRPGPQSYARGAHLRWLKGDLAGATELMRAAAEASSSQESDTAAWMHSRLAGLHFQAGETVEAERTCATALALRSDYPPALLLRGRMLLAQSDAAAAVDALEPATRVNPLPEYQWTLAEALRAAGRAPEAAQVELHLREHGAAADLRTLSLYLATRGEETGLAVRLAQEEFQQRQDVFTHDALAWALAAAGRLDEAQRHMSHALAEGTEDARLFFHAGVIAAKTGRFEDAREWITKAAALTPLLLPSELRHLEATAELIASSTLAGIP
jgi:tetratricopeptide (TPR) repeat protein